MRRKTIERERGSVTIEATISLTMFLFLMICILSFINISRVQSILNGAVDQASSEIAQFAYYYKASGLYDLEAEVQDASEKVDTALEDTLNNTDSAFAGVEAIFGNIGEAGNAVSNVNLENAEQTYESVQSAVGQVQENGEGIQTAITNISNTIGDVSEDPVGYVRSLMAVLTSEASDMVKSYLLAAPIAKGICNSYLKASGYNTDALLRNLGVVGGLEGLNFNKSTLFDSSSHTDVNIVCVYEVRLFPWLSRDHFKVTLAVCGSTRAWVGDSTSTYAKTEEPGEEGGDEEEPEEEEEEKINIDAEQLAISSTVWDKGWAERGKEIEACSSLGANLPDTFPVVDCVNEDNTAVSKIYSLDSQASSYEGSGFYTKVKGEIDKLIKFNGADAAGHTVSSAACANKTFILVLPNKPLNETQLAKYQKIKEYAAANNITLRTCVTE